MRISVNEIKNRLSFPLFCFSAASGIAALVATPLCTTQNIKKIGDGKEVQYHEALGWMVALIASTITYTAMKTWDQTIADPCKRIHLIAFKSLKLLLIASLTTLAASEIRAETIEIGSVYGFMLLAALIPYFLLFEDKPLQHLNAKGALAALAILSGGIFEKACLQVPQAATWITQDECLQQFVNGAERYVDPEICSISLEENDRAFVGISTPWSLCGYAARLPYLYDSLGFTLPYGFLETINLNVKKGFWRPLTDFPNLTQSQYNWAEQNNYITPKFQAPLTMNVNYVNFTDVYELFIEGQGTQLFNFKDLCSSWRFAKTLEACLSPLGRIWWEGIRSRIK